MSFAPSATENAYSFARHDARIRGNDLNGQQRPLYQRMAFDSRQGNGPEGAPAPVSNAVGTREPSRIPFSRTRTLRDAFNTAGKGPDDPLTRDNEINKAANISNGASQENNPPASHRTNYSDMNSVSSRSRYTQYRDTSPSPGARRYDANDNDISSGSASSGMGELSDEARKALQNERDKKRLNSLTHRPVDQANKPSPEPSLNVPTSWGRPKSKATSNWLAGVHNSNEHEAAQDNETNPLFDIGHDFGSSEKNDTPNNDLDIEFNPPSMQLSTSPFLRPPLSDVRKNRPTTSKIATLTKKPPVQSESKIPSPTSAPVQSAGLGIRRSSFDPPSDNSNGSNSGPLTTGLGTGRPKLRGGARNLLNKLQRNVSPSIPQQQTPAAQKSKVDDILYAKTPKVTGAWVDTPAPPTKTYEPEVEPPKEEPMVEVKKENVNFEPATKIDLNFDKDTERKEPRIRKVKIGETEAREPLRSIENDKSKPSKPPTKASTKIIPKPKPILKKPKLPRSALESVIEELKSEDAEDKAGDSTIESLQKLVDDPNATIEFKPPEVKTEDLDEKKIKLEDIESAPKPADKEIKTKLEDAKSASKLDDEQNKAIVPKTQNSSLPTVLSANNDSIDRMDAEVQILVQRIKEAQTGLTSIEKQLSKSPSNLAKQLSRPLMHTDSTYCDHCGRHGDGRIYIAIPIPHLFTRNPRTQRLQLTPLGWTSLGLSIYLCIEYLLSTYLYPRHSLDCDRGICVYPDAPSFPLISLTLLWRMSGLGYLSYIFWPVKIVCVIIFRFLMHAFGFWDGYVDDGSHGVAGTSSATVTQRATPDAGTSGLLSGLASGWPGNWRWSGQNNEVVQPQGMQEFPQFRDDILVDADLGMTQDEFVR
ncbi:hypothetical protein KEM56_003291 [Ascosphaera pollenicola]|nr:hypothetical protein KEM56_003291 [Ascosphaera pollenicola]